MLNLLRMNFYRATHSRNLLIILLILGLGVATFSTYMSYYDLKERGEEYTGTELEEGLDEASDYSEFGIYIQAPINDDGGPTSFLEYFLNDIKSGLMLLFFTIAAATYVYDERRFGFIKNIAGQTGNRIVIYLSKTITIVTYVLFSMLVYALVQFVSLLVFFGTDLKFGINIIGDAIPVLGAQILLYTAFVSGVIMITSITRSSTIGIVTGILSSMGVTVIIVKYIDKLFDLNLYKYMIIQNINSIGIGDDKKSIIIAIVLGVVFTIVYNAVGAVSFSKRDVV